MPIASAEHGNEAKEQERRGFSRMFPYLQQQSCVIRFTQYDYLFCIMVKYEAGQNRFDGLADLG